MNLFIYMYIFQYQTHLSLLRQQPSHERSGRVLMEEEHAGDPAGLAGQGGSDERPVSTLNFDIIVWIILYLL